MMLRTEEEASRTPCPVLAMARNWKALDPNESGCCAGSNCMAWRWSGDGREVGTDRKCERCKGSGVIVFGSGETAGGEECPACVAGFEVEAVPVGYCGLAGRAE